MSEDFEDAETASARWTKVGDEENIEIADGKVHIAKGLNNKLVAGDEAWSDFALEAEITLGQDGVDSGNAGVLIRSTQEAPAPIITMVTTLASGWKAQSTAKQRQLDTVWEKDL